MGFNEWINLIGFSITILSLATALYATRSRIALQKYFRTQNWFLYNKASNANGLVQAALSRYMKLGKDAIDPELLLFLSQADAFGQDVMKDTLRLIQYSEKKLDGKTVKRWVDEGRVQPGHAAIFRMLTPAHKRLPDNPPATT